MIKTIIEIDVTNCNREEVDLLRNSLDNNYWKYKVINRSEQ